jgi:hypothetical protein
MRKSSLWVLGVLLLAVILSNGPFAFGSAGNVIITIDRIEWAAVQFQALYGNALPTPDVPVTTACVEDPHDNTTVLCVVRPTPAGSPEAVRSREEALRLRFDAYKKSTGWNWLKLKFDEEPAWSN